MPAETAPALPYSAPVKEAARLTGIGKTRLYELMADGTIEARKHGMTTLVIMDGLRRYVDSLPKANVGAGTSQPATIRARKPRAAS